MNDPAIPALVADENHYPAILELFRGAPAGRIIDIPSGHGAFANELLKLGYRDLYCLDLYGDQFMLRDQPGVHFTQHDARNPLPFPDGFFDYAFSIEGLEHFDSPFAFVTELCRVVKPGGRLYLTTPNVMSVDARLKFLLAGYFPRFRPLMRDPERLVQESAIHAHISPIYFWQLNHFLLRSGASVSRVGTNTRVYKPQWIKRAIEKAIAAIIRRNVKKRGFPDQGVTSEDMLFGDCIIIEAIKKRE